MSRLVMPADPVCRRDVAHAREPTHIDRATAVMLNILVRKCKMSVPERSMKSQYRDVVGILPGRLFDSELHQHAANARRPPDDAGRAAIHEKRELAETVISRSLMKDFKTMIREQSLFAPGAGEAVI